MTEQDSGNNAAKFEIPLAVGLGLGLLLVIAVLYWLHLRKGRRSRSNTLNNVVSSGKKDNIFESSDKLASDDSKDKSTTIDNLSNHSSTTNYTIKSDNSKTKKLTKKTLEHLDDRPRLPLKVATNGFFNIGKSNGNNPNLQNGDNNSVSSSSLGSTLKPKKTNQPEPMTMTMNTSSSFTMTSEATWHTDLGENQKNMNISIPGFLRVEKDKSFKELQVIGKGGTGRVIKAKVIDPNLEERFGLSEVALKYLERTDSQNQLRFEIALLGSIPKHSNVYNFLGYFTEPILGLVLEKYTGSVFQLLTEQYFENSMERCMILARDTARGMEHIHKCGIIHFDLKPGNILYHLLRNDGDGVGQNSYVISDFGYARPINLPITGGWGSRLVKGLQAPEDIGLTVRYCAPELLRIVVSADIRLGQFEDELLKVDVFAFAIIMYEVLSGFKAWNGLEKNEIPVAILKGVRPPINNLLKDDAGNTSVAAMVSLIRESWDGNASKRPSFSAILERLSKIPMTFIDSETRVYHLTTFE